MSKYSPITEFLKNQPAEKRDLIVSYDTLEEILGFMLPESAYKYQAWWGNEKNKNRSQAHFWMEAGWKVESVDFSKLRVRFKKVSGKFQYRKTSPNPHDQSKTEPPVLEIPPTGFVVKNMTGAGRRIVLVSCVKTKAERPLPAEKLYISDLFQKSSAYARHIGDNWFILSAKYGLLQQDQVIAPYEKTLKNMGVRERKTWADQVLSALVKIVSPGDEIVFLAGVRYREFLTQQLEDLGYRVSIPMEGLSFGNQLKWLKNRLG